MELQIYDFKSPDKVARLFADVFAEAESSPSEGEIIGRLAAELLSLYENPREEIYGYVAVEEGEYLGAILFTPLKFSKQKDMRV